MPMSAQSRPPNNSLQHTCPNNLARDAPLPRRGNPSRAKSNPRITGRGYPNSPAHPGDTVPPGRRSSTRLQLPCLRSLFPPYRQALTFYRHKNVHRHARSGSGPSSRKTLSDTQAQTKQGPQTASQQTVPSLTYPCLQPGDARRPEKPHWHASAHHATSWHRLQRTLPVAMRARLNTLQHQSPSRVAFPPYVLSRRRAHNTLPSSAHQSWGKASGRLAESPRPSTPTSPQQLAECPMHTTTPSLWTRQSVSPYTIRDPPIRLPPKAGRPPRRILGILRPQTRRASQRAPEARALHGSPPTGHPQTAPRNIRRWKSQYKGYAS